MCGRWPHGDDTSRAASSRGRAASAHRRAHRPLRGRDPRRRSADRRRRPSDEGCDRHRRRLHRAADDRLGQRPARCRATARWVGPTSRWRTARSIFLGTRCLVAAAVACVVLSFLAGWRSGLTHLFLGVAFGHLYNLCSSARPCRGCPYAVAFGCLPAVVSLAGDSPVGPPAWMVTAAAPRRRGTLPQHAARLRRRRRHGCAGAAAPGRRDSVPRDRDRAARGGVAVAVLGPSGAPAVGVGRARRGGRPRGRGAVGRGRAPFYAAIAIALVDVVLLTVVAA